MTIRLAAHRGGPSASQTTLLKNESSRAMTDKQLASRDAKRNLGAELLQSVREMKASKGKLIARVEVPAVTLARMKSGLSQAK